MSSHFATVDAWIANLDSEGEADDIAELIESALSSAGYQVTVSVTAHPNAPIPGEEPA